MKKIILGVCLSTLFVACSPTKTATTAKTSKPKNEQEPVVVAQEDVSVEFDEPVVEEIAMVEEAPIYAGSSGNSSTAPGKSIQFNPNFEKAGRINDNYDFFYEKNTPDRYSKNGIVDKNGNVILPPLFTQRSSSVPHEQLLSIGSVTFGLFNLNELRWTIPMMYGDLNSLGNNLYSAKKDFLSGVVDNNNTTIVPFEWKQINRINGLDNYILVSKDELWGVYSIIEKRLTVPCEYSSLSKLDRQNYFLARKGAKSNIVDINNKQMFKTWYDEVRTSYRTPDYFIVRLNSSYGIVDNNETIIVPIEYLEFNDSPYSDGSYLARNKQGKYGFMTIDGRVTLPFKYDNLKKGSYNNIVSVQDGKCGLVQVNSGSPFEIVTCDFENIKEGTKTFIVEKDKKFGLLNQYGKPLTAIEFESLDSFKESGYYDETNIFLGRKGKNYLLINEQGKNISQSEFTEISPLYRKSQSSYYSSKFNYLKVKTKNGKAGVMDKVGNLIAKAEFDDILAEDDNLFIVQSKGKCGMYSLLTQKMIVDYTYDLIVRSGADYYAFNGKDIEMLSVKSDQVTKTSTIKK